MATATVPAHRPTALELLRARAWIVPCVLVMIAVAVSVAGAQRGTKVASVDLFATEPVAVAVRCEVRQGFTLRLKVTAQVMARALLRGDRAEHARGATCTIAQERP